tara:strand:- start:428 stop:1468 length:1041 start_codon:yes stop_codon:yes gene_type:complete
LERDAAAVGVFGDTVCCTACAWVVVAVVVMVWGVAQGLARGKRQDGEVEGHEGRESVRGMREKGMWGHQSKGMGSLCQLRLRRLRGLSGDACDQRAQLVVDRDGEVVAHRAQVRRHRLALRLRHRENRKRKGDGGKKHRMKAFRAACGMRGTQGNAGAAGGGQNHLREHREELGGDLSLDARREVVHLEQSLLALLRGVAHAGGDGARRAWCVHCASGVRAWRWRARAQVAWRGVAWRCVAGAAARLVRLLLEVHQRVVRVRLHLGLGAPRHPHLPSELNRWGMRRACLHVLMPPSCMSCMHGSVARRGVAWRGVAWRGVARRAVSWRGAARRGVARRGAARGAPR